MAVPLSEIAGIKGDAELAQGGFGTDAVLPENNTALSYLNNAAQLQAGANKYLAEVHNQKLKDYMDNFHNIDLKNLAPGDYDPLSSDYVDLSKDIADNYDVIQNPLKNRELAASLMARESSLRSRIAQSQMDRGMQDENNKFIQAHPDFNTPEYQKNVKDFWSAPLGQRKPFALNPAYVYHPADIAKTAYDQVKQKYATATTDGKYIFTQDGLKAAKPAYLQAYNALLNSDDQYGRSARASMMNAWNHLSPDDKAIYGNDPQKWSDQTALSMMSPDQQDKAGMTTNEFATIKAQGAQTRQTEGMRENFKGKEGDKNRENALLIAGLKGDGAKNGKFDPLTAGEYKNKLYHDFVTGPSQDGLQQKDLDAVWADPKLSMQQKLQKSQSVAEAGQNSLSQNLPNEILQNIYGNNAKVKVKNGIAGETQTEEDVPKLSVIGNKVANNGQALITIKDNTTGTVRNEYIPLSKFFSDLDNVLGPKYAPQLSQGSMQWLQKHTGQTTPDIDKLHTIFTASSAAAGGPSSVSSQAEYDALPAGSQYAAPDGKIYTKNK